MFSTELFKTLNKAINKYDNIKHNTLLHRKSSGDFFIEDVGKIGTFETPISTTFNKNAVKDYGDFHITILAPKGANGVYIEEIMKKGNNKNHNLDEWLLPLGTKYRTLYKNYKTKEAVIILLT